MIYLHSFRGWGGFNCNNEMGALIFSRKFGIILKPLLYKLAADGGL